MIQRAVVILVASTVVACGGEAALDPLRSWNPQYGPPLEVSVTGDDAITHSVRSAVAFRTTQAPERALEALTALGSAGGSDYFGLDVVEPGAYHFDGIPLDPACVTTSSTRVQFTGCAGWVPFGWVQPLAFVPDEPLELVPFEVTLDGSLRGSGDSFSWNYTWTRRYLGSVVRSEAYTHEGAITVTAWSYVFGHGEGTRTETRAGVSADRAGPFSMAWAADLGMTYTTDCPALIVGGEFDQRLVWTRKPSPASGVVPTPDANSATRYHWSSCDTAFGQWGL